MPFAVTRSSLRSSCWTCHRYLALADSNAASINRPWLMLLWSQGSDGGSLVETAAGGTSRYRWRIGVSKIRPTFSEHESKNISVIRMSTPYSFVPACGPELYRPHHTASAQPVAPGASQRRSQRPIAQFEKKVRTICLELNRKVRRRAKGAEIFNGQCHMTAAPCRLGSLPHAPKL